MKTIKLLSVLMMLFVGRSMAQEFPAEMTTALKADDVTAFSKLITKENMNNCYGNYSILSNAVRTKARKCFDLLIEKGADVNKSCNGYVPPLMHAAKYGSLDIVKVLVAKGAKVDYKYEGSYKPANGKTPVEYAEANGQQEIAEFLKTSKKERG